jgi:two-component system sensor histidine kinase BaeS
MRLKLVHQLSLLLAGAALAAVLAMSAVVWWNLRAGFSDYLDARDTPQLERMAQILAKRSVDDPGFEWLRGSRAGMESLLAEFRGESPMSPRRGPPSPTSIEGWIQIADAHGEWLAGRPQPGKPSRIWPVTVQGIAIAEIHLFRNEPASGVDAVFLQRQYLGLGLAGLVILALSLVAAWWSAGRWARPLKSLQTVTQLVAAGDLTQRTEPTGAEEIAQLMADVNTMTESLDRLQKARRLWIAQISHELRTPLSVLRGELEAVQDGARTPNSALIQNLLAEVLHLGRLVGDLHTLSMADVGQLHCEFRMQDVSSELLRISTRYVAMAESRGLTLQVSDVQSRSIMACWDMRRIHQVLTNLFENSLRYTDSPGLIRVSWQAKCGVFRLKIEDSAPSVSKEALPLMFEPLYRADSARTRKVGSDMNTSGSGLGLAIARAIVQAHRGRIRALPSGLGGITIVLILALDPERIA